MDKPVFSIGERVEKLCVVCNEVRGHVVVSITKRGQIFSCQLPKCGARSSFRAAPLRTQPQSVPQPKQAPPMIALALIVRAKAMMHPTFGLGEVTKVIEPCKIDVLFSDRMRRLIHARQPE